MSNSSPFAEPAYDSTQRPPKGNMVTIVAIIAGTLLLMFCGMLGFGYYAVNRLAEQWDVFESSEEDAGFAVEFALQENPEIRDRVGEIQRVEFDSDLTYHEDAGYEDYYYRVHGSEGEALVAVQYDYSEHRWFSGVQIVDGNRCRDPHRDLVARPVPFDSESSQHVYELLLANQSLAAEAPRTADVRWIEYDYDASLEQNDASDLTFVIYTKSDPQTVVARFADKNFSQIQSLHRVDDDGSLAETLYQAATDSEAANAAMAAESATDDSATDNPARTIPTLPQSLMAE